MSEIFQSHAVYYVLENLGAYSYTSLRTSFAQVTVIPPQHSPWGVAGGEYYTRLRGYAEGLFFNT
jgi:hypothetical protein